MSSWSKTRDSIRETLVGKTGARVLLVEGENDQAFFKAMLDRVAPGSWAQSWTVAPARGKQRVLEIIEAEPDWLGVVDRDEWSEQAANAAQQKHVNLRVLPRFCMESYFIASSELWAALPDIQRAKIPGGQAELESQLTDSLEEWLRHGTLWRAVNPLWSGLRAKGFKDALLDRAAAQDDNRIRSTLKDGHEHLDPNRIYAEFQANLAEATNAPLDVKYRKWIHGKQYFSEQVVPALNRLLGQQSADEWRKSLQRTLPLPADLGDLWNKMGIDSQS